MDRDTIKYKRLLKRAIELLEVNNIDHETIKRELDIEEKEYEYIMFNM